MLREILAEKSGMSLTRIERIQETASRLYKTYSIPKRDGSSRTISQPTPELKALQRWLARGVFQRLPVSTCATAYKKGASIRKNALVHAATSFTIHIDFKDFFPSFSQTHVELFLSESTPLSKDDIMFCSSIVSRNGSLTIGAPSSPAVTNALMFSFDSKLNEWCNERSLVYTRYADDINISSRSPKKLEEVLKFVDYLSRSFRFANLEINEGKTAFLSRKYRRLITGVNITPQGSISIGRDRKREIKSLVHRYRVGALEIGESLRLGGLLAFANDIEPSFVSSLKEKYGESLIEDILHQKAQKSVPIKTKAASIK